MYEKELRRIIEASQNNALTFFVGAGVSKLSGAPSWKELIHAICDKMGIDKKDNYSSDEFLQIPQMYYYSLKDNKSEYFKFIKSQIGSISMEPNAIHREMFYLNPVSFITTNYDTLLEDASLQYCQSFKVVARDEDVPSIFGDRFVLKLHGDFTHDNFVLKEEDYLNYSENFKLIETLVKSIFSTNTVVFIGYGLNDYNIKLIMNWTKSLLKSEFRKPIFFYTGDDPLTKEELMYQQSKGLSVIEWQNLTPSANSYIDYYKALFSSVRDLSKTSIEGQTEDEAFDTLFRLLRPLDHLNALRISDVSQRLSPYVKIDVEGVIDYSKKDCLILNKFFNINHLSENEQKNLPQETINKYKCILSIFKKARINRVFDDHKYERFITEDDFFADEKCILFDYRAMHEFCQKEYISSEKNYKKAYYLAKLKRYDEAFILFSTVAKKAFKEQNYLRYYFAESNCINLRQAMKNANNYFGCYDLSTIDPLSASNVEIENLFRWLPVEFRNEYENLKDIHSVNMLYKYSYEAFIDGLKLQKTLETNSIEFGLTSSNKAICRINDYLHFLQGNCIICDMFVEYKNTVKNLMSALVHKYSTQDKKYLRTPPIPFGNYESPIYFDEIDFYCFIECFSDQEIKSLLNKYQIDTIEFHHINLIEKAIENILDYYIFVIGTYKRQVEITGIQAIIKNCLVLLRYINISQQLVNKICSFILYHEIQGIYINDKVMFLDNQIAKRSMYSEETAAIVENALISYIDKQITALKNNEHFDVTSTNTGISYCDLVHYIHPQDKKYTSHRLSLRVSKIVNNNLSQMYSHITDYYYAFLSDYQKKKLISWANKKIAEEFSFDLFFMLINYNARIKSSVLEQLKSFLRKTIERDKSQVDKNGVQIGSLEKPYYELIQVGYWCFREKLKASDFKEFLGINEEFDFYYEYTKFDYSKFDVSFLLNLYPQVLAQIAKNNKVREKIRSVIIHVLHEKNIKEIDYQKLQDILVTYF